MLLGDELAEEFLRRRWPDEHLHVPGNADRRLAFADLPELESVERILDLPHGRVIVQLLDLEGKQRYALAHSREEALAFYAAGHTLEILELEHPALAAWSAQLEGELHLPPGQIHVNAFASRKSRGARTHFDAQENIAVQLKGAKTWRFAPNRHVRYPSYNLTLDRPELAPPGLYAQAPDGFPAAMPDDAQVCEMTPGAVLFLPRGHWHDTETREGESLHLQIMVEAPTWRQVLDFLLKTNPLFESLDWRSPVLDAWVEGAPNPALLPGLAERLERTARALRQAAEGAEAAEAAKVLGSEDTVSEFIADQKKHAEW